MRDLGHYWLWERFVARLLQAITWNSVVLLSVRTCGIHLRAISQAMLKISILEMGLNINISKLQLNLSGVNGLTHWPLENVGCYLIYLTFTHTLSDWFIEYFLWNCSQVNATGPHSWQVNISVKAMAWCHYLNQDWQVLQYHMVSPASWCFKTTGTLTVLFNNMFRPPTKKMLKFCITGLLWGESTTTCDQCFLHTKGSVMPKALLCHDSMELSHRGRVIYTSS